jgi:hypothetical protein
LTGEHWVTDENGEPVFEPDLLTWARWFEKTENRRVAFDDLGELGQVSTVFLGLDHNWQRFFDPLRYRPVLWETMVFGGPLDQNQVRYDSRQAAIGGPRLDDRGGARRGGSVEEAMTMGPGKYDDLCTKAREEAKAAGVLLLVIGGSRGGGFSVQSVSVDLTTRLPAILRSIAAEIEASFGKA